MAFIQGQLVAWIYVYTHSGLSYSRAFVQSIILITMIVCMAMIVIGNNLIVAVGLIGALAVIRFRNILKDTRDTSFIFLALIMGMACGTGNFTYSIIGTLIIGTTLMYLHLTAFGSKHMSDGFIRFQVTSGVPENLRLLFDRHCRSARLVSQRLGDEGQGEIAYRLVLRDPARTADLINEMQGLGGVANVTFVLQEEQGEL
ncbi:MAG: DUF4956 domain-containing protein [Candidatus Sumerlaeia bacterium]|nr:DUF4956 domain-containing protein [Candidatus Sumerlaeia bacterium]